MIFRSYEFSIPVAPALCGDWSVNELFFPCAESDLFFRVMDETKFPISS